MADKRQDSASQTIVTVCTRCPCGASERQRPKLGQKLIKALRAILPHNVSVRGVGCMAACDRPVSVAIGAPGKTQYLFADIQDQADIRALADFALQYQTSRDGWTNAGQRPPVLYDKTVARIPGTLGFSTQPPVDEKEMI